MKRHDSRGKKWDPPRPSAGIRRGAAGLGPRHTALHVCPPTRGTARGRKRHGRCWLLSQAAGKPHLPQVLHQTQVLLGVSPSSGPRCAGAAHTGSWGPINACWAAQGVPEPTPPAPGLAGSSPELLTQKVLAGGQANPSSHLFCF